MREHLNDISYLLDTVTGGSAFAGLATTASTGTKRGGSSSSSNLALQTALTGVTSALDSLKQNQNKSSLDQLLPVALMAKWIRQNG